MGLKEIIEAMKKFIAGAESGGATVDPDALAKGEALLAGKGNDEDATEATEPTTEDNDGEGGETQEADALGAELYALLDQIQDRELADKIKAAINAATRAGDEDLKAEDEEGKAAGENSEETKASDEEEKAAGASDAALDRKIRRLTESVATIREKAAADAQAHFRHLYDAARKVRPLVGEVDPIAFDSAGDIYRYALKHAGTPVKTKDVKALAEMVEVTLVSRRKAASPVAYDAMPGKMDGAFAALSKIKVFN